MDKFWEAVGGKLAERWLAVSVPALVFWLGTLLAWAHGHEGTHRITGWLGRQQVPVQLVTVLVVLIGVAASGVFVQQVTGPLLGLLSGRGPGFLWKWGLRRVKEKAEADAKAWRELSVQVLSADAVPTREQMKIFAELDERVRRRPQEEELCPTRTGNILRTVETWPKDKYGLDAVTVWPRLWLLLPELTRAELTQVRAGLDRAVGMTLWGALFAINTIWAWWAAPVGLAAVAFSVFRLVPTRAEVYADLVESAFDLHRTALYGQLRWPLPATPAEEGKAGKAVTIYLRRGSDADEPVFETPS